MSDNTAEILAELIEAGMVEIVGVGDDGETRYRLTAKGEAKAEDLIHNTVSGAQLFADLMNRE